MIGKHHLYNSIPERELLSMVEQFLPELFVYSSCFFRLCLMKRVMLERLRDIS